MSSSWLSWLRRPSRLPLHYKAAALDFLNIFLIKCAVPHQIKKKKEKNMAEGETWALILYVKG